MNAERRAILSTVLLLTPIVLMAPVSMDVYVPAVPRMMTLLNTSQPKVQMTLSIFIVGMSLGQLLVGPVADHYGRRLTALAFAWLYIVASLICALAHSVEVLIAARLLQALASCGCLVSAWATVRDTYSSEEAPAIYSYLNAAIGLAPILAPILGGYLLYWSDTWRSGFFFLCFWGLGVLALIFLGWKESLREKAAQAFDRSIFAHYRHIAVNRLFRFYAFGAAMGLSALFLFFSISPILLITHLGVAEHHFGYYFGCVASIFLISNLLCPILQRRLGSLNSVILACCFIIIGALATIAWHWQWGLSTVGIVVPTLPLYVGVGMIFGPCTGGALEPFPEMAGTAASLYGFVQFGVPAILGMIIMALPIESMLVYALPMLILGGIGLIWGLWLRLSTNF